MSKILPNVKIHCKLSDLKTVLDGLAVENTREGGSLKHKINLLAVGMSGHSFGAKTTQSVSGEQVLLSDSRIPVIKAAIPMSPSPSLLVSPKKSFGSVEIPWLCMTGTKDGSPAFLSQTTPEDRRKVFDALPATGSMFELVLWEADHLAFTDSDRRRNKTNPSHHRSILATSTAFWDAFLHNDPAAADWLKTRTKEVLEAKDAWMMK